MYHHTYKRTYEWIYSWMDGWLVGWMDGCMNFVAFDAMNGLGTCTQISLCMFVCMYICQYEWLCMCVFKNGFE